MIRWLGIAMVFLLQAFSTNPAIAGYYVQQLVQSGSHVAIAECSETDRKGFELTLNAFAYVPALEGQGKLRPRVREGAQDAVIFRRGRFKRTYLSAASDAPAFLEGQPLQSKVRFCGSFPSISPKDFVWSLSAEDADYRASASGTWTMNAESLSYSFWISRSGEATQKLWLSLDEPLQVDVKDLRTGEAVTVGIVPTGQFEPQKY